MPLTWKGAREKGAMALLAHQRVVSVLPKPSTQFSGSAKKVKFSSLVKMSFPQRYVESGDWKDASEGVSLCSIWSPAGGRLSKP